jgi:hypothetical protein
MYLFYNLLMKIISLYNLNQQYGNNINRFWMHSLAKHCRYHQSLRKQKENNRTRSINYQHDCNVNSNTRSVCFITSLPLLLTGDL